MPHHTLKALAISVLELQAAVSISTELPYPRLVSSAYDLFNECLADSWDACLFIGLYIQHTYW